MPEATSPPSCASTQVKTVLGFRKDWNALFACFVSVVTSWVRAAARMGYVLTMQVLSRILRVGVQAELISPRGGCQHGDE